MRILLFKILFLIPFLNFSQNASVSEVENDLKQVLKEFQLDIKDEFRDKTLDGVILTVQGIGNKFNLFEPTDKTQIDITVFSQEGSLNWIYIIFETSINMNLSYDEKFKLINKWSQPASNVSLYWDERENQFVFNTTELIFSEGDYSSRIYDKLLSYYGALYQLKNN
ncbi:hypothetical protein NE848_09085 [Gramella jeungdoensis]|uniref:YbjN domain-containing protein n=1 Tax=Gramella jeungdoensis TaxID=708091 RepID=A0ABT0Z2B4_9FLAO|nr:hypothetical protein [Gramella jeungdoensis]MCM8569533.1 hypothetical protein [Gramella jeungdoensis]